MNITFYKTTSAVKAVNKALSETKSIEGAIATDAVNILAPEIITYINPTTYNYMYIKEFNRYYFIVSAEATRDGVFIVRGKIDVLYTYRAGILKNRAIIDKSTSVGNASKYLNDGSYNATSKQYVNAYNFESADGYANFTETPTNILITAG